MEVLLSLDKANIEIACALAVCNFKDGVCSLIRVAERLQLEPSPGTVTEQSVNAKQHVDSVKNLTTYINNKRL